MSDKTLKIKPVSMLLLLVLTSIVGLALIIDERGSKLDNVKGVGDVTVRAQVPYYTEIVVAPEKRIPPTGNDSVEIEVQFRSVGSNTTIYSTNLITDLNGIAQLPPLDPDIVPPGQYDISIKGFSHLNKLFTDITLAPLLDLTYQALSAGDTHPSADNLVNSLDVAYSITQLYGNDVRSDLNRDGKVNSLDFATQISHFNQAGDE